MNFDSNKNLHYVECQAPARLPPAPPQKKPKNENAFVHIYKGWKVFPSQSSFSFSNRVKVRVGCRRMSSRAVARPTIPAPTTATSHVLEDTTRWSVTMTYCSGTYGVPHVDKAVQRPAVLHKPAWPLKQTAGQHRAIRCTFNLHRNRLRQIWPVLVRSCKTQVVHFPWSESVIKALVTTHCCSLESWTGSPAIKRVTCQMFKAVK